jgi:mRNA interferase RelE/StbE
LKYTVEFFPEAKRFLKKLLDKDLKKRLVHACAALENNPRPPQCKKMVGGLHRYRIRVSNYRIIYRIG